MRRNLAREIDTMLIQRFFGGLVKKSVPAITAGYAEMKSLRVVFWLCLGARRDTVPLQNVSNRLLGGLVAEVGQCTGDPIASPAGILLGHADDELNTQTGGIAKVCDYPRALRFRVLLRP
jgi:hypothetical protein